MPAMDLLEACCNSRELWEEVISSLQQAIVVTDLKGRILFSSPVTARILHYTPDELFDKSLALLFTEEDMACLYPNVLYLARQKQPFEGEVMLVRKDGSRFIAYLATQPSYDPRHDREIVIACIQDIDKQKQMEKAYTRNH